MTNKSNKGRDTPVIEIPDGYDIFDLLDTDDDGYELGDPIKEEEAKVRYE